MLALQNQKEDIELSERLFIRKTNLTDGSARLQARNGRSAPCDLNGVKPTEYRCMQFTFFICELYAPAFPDNLSYTEGMDRYEHAKP